MINYINTGMQSYSIADAIAKHNEVFSKANDEPVLLTERSQPTHVIMSADTYQKLLERIEELEDSVLGEAAKKAQDNYKMVGVENFTSTLERMANGET